MEVVLVVVKVILGKNAVLKIVKIMIVMMMVIVIIVKIILFLEILVKINVMKIV
jgi:hypothetical protein